MSRVSQRRTERSGQRGAALILTIVVILVLSTIGIAMVSVTENEENTAASYRDQMQAQALAEAGVRVAAQMFRAPNNRQLVPAYSAVSSAGSGYDFFGTTATATETSLNALGIYRRQRPGAGTVLYTGSSNRLFVGPFDTNWERTFGGSFNPDPTADNFDISFRRSAPGSSTVIAGNWLDNKINDDLITAGANWNETVGRISEISFYSPPVISDQSYAWATIRVTAEKVDVAGRVVARETVEAIIGDESTTPSILTNGKLEIESTSAVCGDSCQQVHANGDILLGSSGQYRGGNPVITATGTVTTNGSTVSPGALGAQNYIAPPLINPWDLLYKPAGTTSPNLLTRYYLVTNRQPATEWRDNDATTSTPDYACGTSGSMCQDYGLEYNPGTTTVQARGAQSRLYKWNDGTKNWDIQGGAVASGGSHTIGTMNVRFTNAADQAYRATDYTSPAKTVATADDSQIPFNKDKVPYAYWLATPGSPAATAGQYNIVLLVDGNLDVPSSTGGNRNPNPAWRASLIAVGGIKIESSSNMDPALENRVMLIAGRDIEIRSSFNNDLASGGGPAFCEPNDTTPTMPSTSGTHAAASFVVAAHEQIFIDSSSKLLGIIIAENKVNLHNNRGSGFTVFDMNGSQMNGAAMLLESSSQIGYRCNQPPWPFPAEGAASILAMNTAGK